MTNSSRVTDRRSLVDIFLVVTVKLYLVSELVCLTHRLWTVADAPSHVSHRHTIHRRCSRICCTAFHTVGDNKLCGIYLIFPLDLYYIMGSQRQWTVFELLDILSAVNMQLYVRPKNGIIQGLFGNFIH